MVEDIKLEAFPKEAGVYIFSSNDEVIYVGSSKNLYKRMSVHISSIRKGGTNNGISKQDLYQFLQSNPFTVEFQITDDYKQLEQKLIEQHHPRYNAIRAYTGCGTRKGREAEYQKEYQKTNKCKQYIKEYHNQLCFYNGETLTLNALSIRFMRKGIEHPTLEAKKYIKNNNPIEFYDVYP